MIEEVVQTIYIYLLSNGYTWKVNGESVVPSLDLIKEKITVCLDQIQDNQSIEFGRLLVKRSSGYTDFYIHVGEINA